MIGPVSGSAIDVTHGFTHADPLAEAHQPGRDRVVVDGETGHVDPADEERAPARGRGGLLGRRGERRQRRLAGDHPGDIHQDAGEGDLVRVDLIQEVLLRLRLAADLLERLERLDVSLQSGVVLFGPLDVLFNAAQEPS